MRFSSLTDRIVDPGTEAWAIHYQAQRRHSAGEDIIMLSVGQEGEHLTPAPIIDAAVSSLHAGRHHYSAVEGDAELRQAIADYHEVMTGQRVDADHCTFFSGAQNALFSVAQCLLEPGDEVILSEPYYTTYPATFTASGARAVSVQVSAQNDYRIDPAAVLAAVSPRTRAIVLNSPSNPLGTVYVREQFEPIANYCREHRIWLISDEVYASLVAPEARFSPASLDQDIDYCVTVSSLSKSHRMTGWRCGWAVAPVALTRHLWNLALCMHYGLPGFVMSAALAALRHESIGDEVRQAVQKRRQVLHATLQSRGSSRLIDSGSGMFVLLDVADSGMTAYEFAEALLNRQRVATLPCDGFGTSGRYLLRIGLCVDEQAMAEACRRINQFTAGL